MSLHVQLVPVLKDNYSYILFEDDSPQVGIVDPGDAEPIRAVLEKSGWEVSQILNTHHHADHIGGNAGLIAGTAAVVVGPEAERQRIPELGYGMVHGDTFAMGATAFSVIATPGHTHGQVAFYFESEKMVFTGDTLFALGCGRLFEGTPEEMWTSLLRLRSLPADTMVYCGHEYTESNCRFALTIEPENEALKARAIEIAQLRAEGKPTVPSTIGLERETNPFLRADVPSVQTAIGMAGADAVAVFAEIRRRKDVF